MKEIQMMTKIICVMKDTIYCSRPTVNGQRSHVRHIISIIPWVLSNSNECIFKTSLWSPQAVYCFTHGYYFAPALKLQISFYLRKQKRNL